MVLSYLLMLTNTAVFFIFWKKSLLQSPLVAGVKEQATMMKSDSAASWVMGTRGGQGSIRGYVQVRESKWCTPNPQNRTSQGTFGRPRIYMDSSVNLTGREWPERGRSLFKVTHGIGATLDFTTFRLDVPRGRMIEIQPALCSPRCAYPTPQELDPSGPGTHAAWAGDHQLEE